MVEKCLHCERNATSEEQTCDEHSPHENAKAVMNGGLLLGGLLVLVIWLPEVGFWLLCFALAIGVIYLLFRPLAQRDKRRVTERLERRRLAANADREHELAQRGDPGGIYGDFTPPIDAMDTGRWATTQDGTEPEDRKNVAD